MHRDPRGFARLSRLLDREKPSFITVEFSEYSRAFRAAEGRRLRALLRERLGRLQKEEQRPLKEILSHGQIQGIFLLLKEPFEWRASEAYARCAGAVLKAIDLSPYAQEKLAHVTELLEMENLRSLLRIPSVGFAIQAARQYDRARRLLMNPPSSWPVAAETRAREAFMADMIRRVMKKRERSVMHIGGWEHLLDPPQGHSLFKLLNDLQPQRILLGDEGDEISPASG